MVYSSHVMGGFHKVGTCSSVSLFKDSHVATLYSTSVFIYLLSILCCKDSVRKCARLNYNPILLLVVGCVGKLRK